MGTDDLFHKLKAKNADGYSVEPRNVTLMPRY